MPYMFTFTDYCNIYIYCFTVTIYIYCWMKLLQFCEIINPELVTMYIWKDSLQSEDSLIVSETVEKHVIM